MPEEQRRHTLLEAAAAVFLRDGYAASSMDKVAREAGMSKRTLYRLFPSKAALFEATINDSLAPLHLDPALLREMDLQVALTGILEASGRHLLALRPIGIFRLVIAEQGRSPELAETFHRVLVRRGASALQRLIGVEMERGRLRPGNPEATGRLLYGMAFGSTQIRLLLGVRKMPSREEVAALARDAVEVFLTGARPEAAWHGPRASTMPLAIS
jgi:TetR/AcrR family transcriptional regulator of autoinduction and epiphytic fitness